MRQLQRSTPNFWFILTSIIASLSLFFWRYSYNFGGADHDEILSLVYKLQDPSLYSKDVFFNNPFDLSNVRFFSTYFLNFFSLFFGLESATLFLYLGSWIAISTALFKIAEHFTKSQWTAALSVIATLVLTHKSTLGHNDFVYIQYTPEMLAWAFCTWGVFCSLERRFLLISAPLFGIATLFHPVLGLAHFILWVIWQSIQNNRNLKLLFLPGLVYLAFALYVLVPQVLMSNQNPAAVFRLITEIRLPVHFNPAFFGLPLVIKFGVITLLGLLGWATVWGELLVAYRKQLRLLWILIFTLCAVAFLASIATFSGLSVYKFQFWKLSVWLKFFMITGIIYALLFQVWNSTQAAANPIFFLFLVCIFAGFTYYEIQQPNNFLADKYQPKAHLASDLGKMEQWIAAKTPKDALFIVEPGNTTFRNYAKRSVFATWLAFPFTEKGMMEWKNRMDILTGLSDNVRWSAAATDEAFYNIHKGKWDVLLKETNAQFLLLSTKIPQNSLQKVASRSLQTQNLQPLKTIGSWTLFEAK